MIHMRKAKETKPDADTEQLLKDFEQIVGTGQVEALFQAAGEAGKEPLSAEGHRTAFRRDFAIAVDRYHATLTERELRELLRFKAYATMLQRAIVDFMGEDNYRAMLETFAGSQ